MLCSVVAFVENLVSQFSNIVWAVSREKGYLEFPSDEYLSTYDRLLSKASCLVYWLKFLLGIPLK